MFKRTLISATIVALCSAASAISAAETGQLPQQAQQPAGSEQIYGSQLMTREERIEHRAKMRAAKTPQEREKIRADHHVKMQECARERGITLPDAPPAGGMSGMGQGMRPGPRP